MCTLLSSLSVAAQLSALLPALWFLMLPHVAVLLLQQERDEGLLHMLYTKTDISLGIQ